jgi:hypothetical protein
MNEPTMTYDAAARKALIEFPNGHKLRVGNIDEEQAKAFFEKNAKEFERRDCVLHTSACIEVRSDG